MARRHAELSRTFMKDPFLKEFFLDGVVTTGKVLGVGSYGSVVEVNYKHVTCAAKQLHELLMDPGNEGVCETVQKYQRECRLMASLRHPNITQFLGLCFLEASPLPLLVMERLEMSVDDLLECAPNIPLPVKLSILTDTCSGLAYLHGMKTPIVHRDLTARNILLTLTFSAKIADLGNSRIVSLTPGQLAQTLSKNPGTTVYMAPEALSDSHRYGPSLDLFSFGHLCLYTLTQVFPGYLLAATQADPDNPGRVIGRTEVERREVYMKKLEGQFSESHPVLVQLVSQCLDNDPQTRPTSEEALGRLQEKKKEIEGLHGGHLGEKLIVASLIVAKEIKSKDKLIRDLLNSEARLEAEVEELIANNTRLEAENARVVEEMNHLASKKNEVGVASNQTENDVLTQIKEENSQLQENYDKIHKKNSQIKKKWNQFRMEVNTKKKGLEEKITLLQSEKHELESRLKDQQSERHEHQDHLKDLQSEKNELKSRLEDLQSEKHKLESCLEDQQLLVSEKQSLEQIVEQLKKDLQAIKTAQEQLQTAMPQSSSKIFPLSLEWRQGTDMPSATSTFLQVVEVEGTVFVGGGYTGSYDDDHIVMAYNMRSSQWHCLPPCSVRYFSMAVVSNQVVIVGGFGSMGTYSRELGVWQTNDRQWAQPFPPMPTARSRSSSTCYKHWLVVAGGYSNGKRLDDVEILDVDSNQWFTGQSTPTPWYDMKSTVMGDTWYFMGGFSGNSHDVYSASLDAVITKPLPKSLSIWQKITPLESVHSCPLYVGGSLLAVGGRKDFKPTSAIMRYEPRTATWIPAGDLPQTLYNCTCIVVSDNMYVLGGYNGSTIVKAMHYHVL